MFASRVKPKTQYQIFWRIELGEDNQDNGLVKLNAQYKRWDCDHVLCLGPIEATCTDFWRRYDYPEKFPARNIIPTTDSFLAMHCFNSEEYAEIFLPMVSRNQEALR